MVKLQCIIKWSTHWFPSWKQRKRALVRICPLYCKLSIVRMLDHKAIHRKTRSSKGPSEFIFPSGENLNLREHIPLIARLKIKKKMQEESQTHLHISPPIHISLRKPSHNTPHHWIHNLPPLHSCFWLCWRSWETIDSRKIQEPSIFL